MKYFNFLAKFVGIPLLILSLLAFRDRRRDKKMPDILDHLSPEVVLLGHVVLAVGYTTPWDNYLVKTRVWWYDRDLVTGVTLGYVPIEEYTFFVLQTLMTGAWTLHLARNLPTNENTVRNPGRVRLLMTLTLGAVWLVSVLGLLRGGRRWNYMSLMLSWALPPIMLQTAFGGDILWQHRRLVALGIIPATAYLGVADSLAIGSGTWTINPEQSLDFNIAGKLPLEELIFFLLTNTLVVLGVVLTKSRAGRARLDGWLEKLRKH